MTSLENSETFDLLDTDQLLKMPPTDWLIKDVLPSRGFIGLYGPPSSGKSFVALDIALSISQGIPWLGRYPVTRAPVIYIAAEGGAGIKQRVRAWMELKGVTPSCAPNETTLPGMYYYLQPLRVREDEVVANFLTYLDEISTWPGLIVIDTLSRCFSNGEENASEDMAHFVDKVTTLAAGRYMAALVAHHTNATGGRERGHTSFRGAADAMFRVEAKRSKDGKIQHLIVTNDKQKDQEELAPIYLQKKDLAGSLAFEWVDAPEAPKEPGHSLPKPMSATAMLLALRTAEDGLTWNEWRIASQLDKTSFNNRVRRLIKQGEIFKEDGRYRIMPALEDLADIDEEGVAP